MTRVLYERPRRLRTIDVLIWATHSGFYQLPPCVLRVACACTLLVARVLDGEEERWRRLAGERSGLVAPSEQLINSTRRLCLSSPPLLVVAQL